MVALLALFALNYLLFDLALGISKHKPTTGGDWVPFRLHSAFGIDSERSNIELKVLKLVLYTIILFLCWWGETRRPNFKLTLYISKASIVYIPGTN